MPTELRRSTAVVSDAPKARVQDSIDPDGHRHTFFTSNRGFLSPAAATVVDAAVGADAVGVSTSIADAIFRCASVQKQAEMKVADPRMMGHSKVEEARPVRRLTVGKSRDQ